MICVTAQYPSFTEVEHNIEEALDELATYYRSNSLRVNTAKTQVTSFHLENTPRPKYLGGHPKQPPEEVIKFQMGL